MPISLEKRQNLFLSIEEFARRRYGWVFLVFGIVLTVAGVLGSMITLDTDILDLVPEGDRQVDAFKASLVEFGAADYIAVLIESPPDHTADEYLEFADLYAERVEGLESVTTVEHRIGGSARLLEVFRKYSLLFMPPEDIHILRDKLSEKAIREQVAMNRRILESPSSTFAKDLIRNDPLGFGPLLMGRFASAKASLRFSTEGDGYYLSADRSTLLVLIKPEQPAQNLGFTGELVGNLRRIEQETRDELADSGTPGVENLGVDYAGTYITALNDSDLIKSDMKLTAVVSFVGILALYYIGYRRFGALVYSSLPLVAGQILTFAVAFLVLGTLNSASSGFVAMVMGLGTDFTIVMYARYVEERRKGLSLAEASRRMMGEGGLGMFTGAITSAGTFYAMTVTEFRGLWELGFLIGSGILLSMVAIVFLLPAMIQWNEGRSRRKELIKKLHVQSFGFEHLIPVAVRRPYLTLGILAVVTVFGGIAAWNVGFSDNVSDLRSPNNEGLKAQDKLREKFGGDLNSMLAMVEAESVNEAVSKATRVIEASRPFVDEGIVLGVDSILNYLPTADSQEEVIRALSEDKGFDADRIEASFRRSLDAEGFRENAFDDYIDDFRSVLARSEPLTLEELRDHDLGPLLQRYIKEHEEDGEVSYRMAVYLFLEQQKWRREAPPGLVNALQGDDPAVTVTGVNIVSKRLRDIFARDAKKAIGVGLILVSVLLWLDFRSLRLMMVANIQVLVGVVWMLGVMSLAGVQMNFVNAFVATMILGVGVDYGIHLIHRMCLNGGVVDQGVLETGKGVAMAAMTNLVGFGALALSNYPGLRSVGIISMVGSIACLITALTLLPALMSLKGFSSAVTGRTDIKPVDA